MKHLHWGLDKGSLFSIQLPPLFNSYAYYVINVFYIQFAEARTPKGVFFIFGDNLAVVFNLIIETGRSNDYNGTAL